ncbi:MAG: hypothetical protein WCD80_05795 [Desulfobaccales bacterium]
MKVLHLKRLALIIVLASAWLISGQMAASAGVGPALRVSLQAPAGALKMGDTPNFLGGVTNLGPQPVQGLVVYLSLVSMAPGDEHPVDLEDWSAQKAVRIDRLNRGAADYRNWGMRLIAAGKFGVALTVVDPREPRPIVSDLVPFEIQPKATLVAGRVLPVAIGEPLLIVLLLGGIFFYNSRSYHKHKKEGLG